MAMRSTRGIPGIATALRVTAYALKSGSVKSVSGSKLQRKAKTVKAKPKSEGLVLDNRAYVDDQAATLEGKLNAARTAWVTQFWTNSGLGDVKKADADEPIYFDDSNAALTPEQAAALKKIVADLNDTGYAQALYDEMALAVEAGWISGKALLKLSAEVQASFDVVPATTLGVIQEQADKFAFLVNEREQQQLVNLIDAAIADGQTAKSLAVSIQDSFADGYHVTDESGELVRTDATDAWSKMVSRTEISRAQTIGQLAIYREAGIEKVRFQTDHGATVCDECSDMDGELFDASDADDIIPVHPNCCCSMLPADKDVEYPGVTAKYQDAA
jgi:SPP1 gp7 family putative phage head morphogenesis protein